jgi:hypothetical protein
MNKINELIDFLKGKLKEVDGYEDTTHIKK